MCGNLFSKPGTVPLDEWRRRPPHKFNVSKALCGISMAALCRRNDLCFFMFFPLTHDSRFTGLSGCPLPHTSLLVYQNLVARAIMSRALFSKKKKKKSRTLIVRVRRKKFLDHSSVPKTDRSYSDGCLFLESFIFACLTTSLLTHAPPLDSSKRVKCEYMCGARFPKIGRRKGHY
jgi:hypothetical protein